MEATETIRCRGHRLVSASHPTTFEVTKETFLTETGHCIVGIGADKGAADLSPAFKQALCHDDALLVTVLRCGNVRVEVKSKGSAAMALDHPSDLVWRKSAFVCGRTVGICSDTVASTLPEELAKLLRGEEEMTVTMTVTRPG